MERIGVYEVLGQLGRGGMGVVLRARCSRTGVDAALKLVTPAALTADGLARFEQEVLALTRLRHPNVVCVLDAGRSERGPWLAMEWIDGESLQARLERDGPLAPDDVVRIGRALCAALAHAHGMGVVHRDVKPANVLLGRDGRVVLADFGLAHLAGRDARLTATGELLGTPCFMAPEQARSERAEIGPLADVYAVGATLYAALTGRPPIQGKGVVEVLERTLHHVPEPLAAVRPEVPACLSAVVMQCLEKDPAHRPASVEALSSALSSALSRALDVPSRRPGRVAAVVLLSGALSAGASHLERERARAALARDEQAAQALDASALVMRGRDQLRRGDADGARRSAEEALRLAPDDLRAVSLRGAAAMATGRADDARRDMRRLVDAERPSAALLLDAAMLAELLGEHDVALAATDRALALGPSARGEVLRISSLLKLDRRDEAARRARAAAQAFPDSSDVLWAHAAVLSHVDVDAAARVVEDGASRWPTSRQWQGVHAKTLEERGDLRAAEAVWSSFLRLCPDDVTALRARARLRRLLDDHDGVAADLEEAARLAPDDVRVWGSLLEAQRRRGAREGMARALDRIVELLPDAPGWLLQRAEVRHALGRNDEALADVDRALELDAGNGRAWSDRGVLRVLMGDAAGGARDLERAVALDPASARSWSNLARARLDLQQPAGALEAAQRSLELRPASAHAEGYAARALLALGDVQGAFAAYERALSLARDDAERRTLEAELAPVRAAAGR